VYNSGVRGVLPVRVNDPKVDIDELSAELFKSVHEFQPIRFISRLTPSHRFVADNITNITEAAKELIPVYLKEGSDETV
jgi:hypothetical protein